ncbi:MAG: Ig-like domain-containing protein, partial [Bacteroidales bacterium]|nr:Ig-like domain-containing protein [Bacteroidales bacterium]
MKKYFSIAVLCALAVLGLGSCAKDIEEEIVTEQTGVRTVNFSASLADQTKTGLSMKFVPNWINTSLENVHLFETSGSTILEGVDVEMRVPEDRNNEVAYFKADFAEEISIIVNPPSQTGVKTRAADEYTYTGIVAQKVDGKFTVPSTQYPDPVSLIDPNADFLVGDTKTTFSESMALKEMDIYFVRPVSVSRLAIMNIEGQKVKTVKITSTDKLTASAAYSDVNFSTSTVTWDNSGSNVITISYGEGKDIPAEATFYAYFISLPGNKNITSVEVTTDQYVYTKSYASGKTLKFDTVEFRNIAVDMSKVTPTPVGPVAPVDQDIYFFKNNGHVSEDSYDLYPGTTAYVTPELRGAATGATVTYSIACTPAGAATITPAGVVTPVAVGTAVITATASAVTGYKETEISYTLTITDSTPDAVDQELSFVKGGETVETDSFDLYPAGGTYTAPTLTGAAEGATVTYAIECTPEGVATINASTGAVTPVAVGTAVITATASAVAPLYKQTSKSYTLTVTDSTPAPVEETTYKFVSGALSEGTYLIIGDDLNANPTTTVALFPNTVTKDWGGSSPATNGICVIKKEITLDGTNPITTTDPEIVGAEVELIASGNGWKVKAKGGKYLVSPTSTSDANHVYFSENAADGSVFTAGNVTSSSNSANGRSFTVSGSSLYLFHSGSASGFTIRGGTTVSNLRFYKKAKKTQNLAFVGTSAEYDLKDGGSWTIAVPDLDASGAETTIAYASSNTAVAEVNTNSGVITIPSTAKKGDSAVITATAEETDEYEEATATYTISIVDSTPGVMATYKKVTSQSELVADGTYLIVYENGTSSKVFKPIRNGSSFTTSTANAEAVTISNNTITSSELDDHTVVFRNADGNTKFAMWVPGAGCYLILRRNNASFVADDSDNGYRATFTVGSGGSVTIVRAENNTSYYLRYSSSNSYFQVSNTSNNSTVALYKLDDGTTPTPAEQTIAFTPASAQYDLYTKAWTPSMPVLGGAQTDVNYESSDATVASVAADGTITPLKVGEVTVTATAAATPEYLSATNTCSVEVVDSTP